MYSLMIVDDEPIVLRAISHVVETYCPQVKVVAKTGSGVEAVSLALQKKPDIIFMDIELTGFNGLEAAKEIKKAFPETIIIIISAYDNFQYAREGLTLGVMDYLLKPVAKDDLITILSKAVTRLDGNTERTREQLELKDKLKKMKPFLEEGLFFSLLYPGVGRRPLSDYLPLLDLKITFGQAVEIYITDCNLLSKNFEHYKQVVNHQLPGVKVALFSPIIGRTALILIGYDVVPDNPKKIWGNVRQLFQINYGFSASVILGRTYEGFEGMIRSFNELRKISWLYIHQPGVYDYDDFPELSSKKFSVQPAVEQEFFNAIKMGWGELARSAFHDLFQEATAAFGDDLTSLKDYFRGILAVLKYVYFENTPESRKQIWDGNYLVQQINEINDPNELAMVFDNLIVELAGLIIQGTFPGKNPEIQTVMEYIEKNYQQDLTLSDIAAAVIISPNYLTKLFKEFHNQTVMDYLERVRIEQALKYLKTTSYSIKEIAYRVGYKDPNYFSKVFKKVTNFSPTEFKSK